LDIDLARQHFLVGIEEPGAAIGAEMASDMFRGRVDLGCALRHLDGALRIHRPADHRRAGVAPAIGTMTERMHNCFALDFVADRAAVAAAGNHGLPSSFGPNVRARSQLQCSYWAARLLPAAARLYPRAELTKTAYASGHRQTRR